MEPGKADDEANLQISNHATSNPEPQITNHKSGKADAEVNLGISDPIPLNPKP